MTGQKVWAMVKSNQHPCMGPELYSLHPNMMASND